jgi:hypothetical protein
LLFVWPPVGGGFIATPLAARPEGSTPLILPKGELLGGPEESHAGVPCILLSATGLRYIRIIPDVGDTILRVIHTC